MKRCDPVEMKRNMQLVKLFEDHKIDFVPIPVSGQEQKSELVCQMNTLLTDFKNEFDEVAHAKYEKQVIHG